MSAAKGSYKPKKVFSSPRASDIEIVKMALENEGIPYELNNENLAAIFPGVDGLTQVEVLVNEGDEERAREVIEAQFKSD